MSTEPFVYSPIIGHPVDIIASTLEIEWFDLQGGKSMVIHAASTNQKQHFALFCSDRNLSGIKVGDMLSISATVKRIRVHERYGHQIILEDCDVSVLDPGRFKHAEC